MSDTFETESKFTIPSTSVPDLMRLHRLGDFLRIEDRQARHVDVYLDTDDGALRRSDSALRWRDIAGGPLMATFKGPPTNVGEGSRREELEDEVPREQVDLESTSFPIGQYTDHPSFEAAREVVGDVMLRPIARIVTNRRSAIFARTTGGRVELSIDRTAGVRLPDLGMHEFIEIELEVESDHEGDLEALSRDLQRQVPELKSASMTKLERVLENAQRR